MITIGTNKFKKLSSAHRKAVANLAIKILHQDESFSLSEYKEAEAQEDGAIRFFFGNFPLKEMVKEITMWDSLVLLLNTIFNYSQEDIPEITEVQFWITSLEDTTPVNLFFSAKKQDDIKDRMLSLRETLTTADVFSPKKVSSGKIAIVGYDKNEGEWRINYL